MTLNISAKAQWEILQELKGKTVEDILLKVEGESITAVTLKFSNKRAISFNLTTKR